MSLGKYSTQSSTKLFLTAFLTAFRSLTPNLLVFALVFSSTLVGSAQDRAERQQREGRQRGGNNGRGVNSEFQEAGFVTYADGDQATCRDMTPDEVVALQRDLDPLRQLRVISQRERQEALGTTLEATPEGANGLTIILRSTAQLDGFPHAKAAFIRAAAQWEAQIKNHITIVLDVDYGPTRFGQAYPSGVLGSTSTPSTLVGYDQIRAKLVASASSAAETTLYNALPNGSVNTDVGSVGNTSVVSPLMRAFGLLPADADPNSNTGVPTIGFNSNFTFDFNPSDGITAGAIDFDAVAVHEMGHALGFTSNAGLYELSPLSTKALTAWDVFRFRPGTTTATFTTAQRVLSSGGEQRFYDFQPELACSTGRPDGSGGDGRQASHWKADEQSGVYIGIMDPTLASGQRKVMTMNDLRLLETLGYSVSSTVQPPCTYSLSISNASFGTSGGTGSVNVTASASTCVWTASRNVAWISITSGANSTGDGAVNYNVQANTGAARSGTLTIAGQTFTVNQAAGTVACTFTLSATSASVGISGGIGVVSVNASAANCAWTATSNVNWVSFIYGSSGTGNGTVIYNVASNSGSPRSGALTIAGKMYTINQAGTAPTCTFGLTAASANVAATPSNGSVNVNASASNCTWNATSNVSWVSITSGASGTGNGTVNYSVAANTGAARSGTLTIAGLTYTINQAAGTVACTFTLSASSASVGAGGGIGTVNVSASAATCAWTAVSNVPWVTFLYSGSGTGNSIVVYNVAANSGPSRSGTLTIAGKTFTINQ